MTRLTTSALLREKIIFILLGRWAGVRCDIVIARYCLPLSFRTFIYPVTAKLASHLE